MEFLKELFTEPLSYEAFVTKLTEKGIKLANLSEGVYVSKEKFDTLETKLKEANETIKGANEKIESFASLDVDGVKAEAESWKKEFEGLQEKVKETEYARKVEALCEGEKFSSIAAKKQFIAELVAKKLPFQDDKLLGYADFKEAYETSDPTAFLKDDGHVTVTIGKLGAQGNQKMTKEAFRKLGYAEKVQLKKEDPELYKALHG